jgi:hypothetical protein
MSQLLSTFNIFIAVLTRPADGLLERCRVNQMRQCQHEPPYVQAAVQSLVKTPAKFAETPYTRAEINHPKNPFRRKPGH